MTYDTEVNDLYATAYKMEDLLEDLGTRIKAERVVAFLDTCYSGQATFRKLPDGWSNADSRALIPEAAPATATLEPPLRRAPAATVATAGTPARRGTPQSVGRVIITSSGPNERSWEDDRIEHGYFTYYLLDALRKPSASVDDIYKYLSTAVPDAVLRDKHEPQHPKIAKSQADVDILLRDARQ